MEVNEQKIIRLCKQDRKEGFELLFNKYRRFIYDVCLHYVGSKEDALDLTQEVFIKLYRNMALFDESRPLLPWIKRIAVNTCFNYSRRPRDFILKEDAAASLTDHETPEEQVVFQSTKAEIQLAIKGLPDNERMALVLRHVQGLNYGDIGEAMGCPLGTVKTYIFRGRNLLREKLKAAGIWEE